MTQRDRDRLVVLKKAFKKLIKQFGKLRAVDGVALADRAGQDLVGHVGEDVGAPRVVSVVEHDAVARGLDEAEQVAAHFHQHEVEVVDRLARKGGRQAQTGNRLRQRDNIDTDQICPARFLTTTIAVEDTTALQAQIFRRRDHEDAYLRVTSQGQPQPSNFAQVVLYSRETLGKNDERSSFSDWEIVTQYAGR